MKTIIIELPEALSSEGLADALAIIAHDAQRGAVDLSPNQYHYAVPMNLGGTLATATVRSAPTSTRVGPEQASEPAPLPEPWPGLLLAYDDGDHGQVRAAVSWSGVDDAGPFVRSATGKVRWSPDVVSEVRTPDGVTVWKRPAAKVTT